MQSCDSCVAPLRKLGVGRTPNDTGQKSACGKFAAGNREDSVQGMAYPETEAPRAAIQSCPKSPSASAGTPTSHSYFLGLPFQRIHRSSSLARVPCLRATLGCRLYTAGAKSPLR